MQTSKETRPNETRCLIYKGVLPDSTMSNGWDPTNVPGGHAGAWVCSVSSWANRDTERLLDQIIVRSDVEWAVRNVRYVCVESPGVKFTPSSDDYDIIVVGDLKTATHGRLVRKPGKVYEQSVPEGDSPSSLSTASLINRDLPLGDRLKLANATYFSNGSFTGPKVGLYDGKIPAKDHIWIGV